MRRFITVILTALLLILSLTGAVSAAGNDKGWANGPDSDKMKAMAFLKIEASNICSASDSDYDKVKKLNRYVCDKVSYDYSNINSGLVAFVNEDKVICTGYADALAFLLDCVNVKNFTVTDYVKSGRSTVLHVWNAVNVDGEWLHVDPTWNDKTRTKVNPDGGYFLLSCDQIDAGRHTMSLENQNDYDNFYEFIKTVTLSVKMVDSSKYYKQDNIIMAPLTEVVSSLGGYVKESGSGEITVTLNTRILNITIGSETGFLNNEEFQMENATQIVDGIIMVPARLILEKLGASVNYDSSSGVITIDYDPYQARK